jgi:hypothetical protein
MIVEQVRGGDVKVNRNGEKLGLYVVEEIGASVNYRLEIHAQTVRTFKMRR